MSLEKEALEGDEEDVVEGEGEEGVEVEGEDVVEGEEGEEEQDDIADILEVTASFIGEDYKELLAQLADQMEDPYEGQTPLELCELKELAKRIRELL